MFRKILEVLKTRTSQGPHRLSLVTAPSDPVSPHGIRHRLVLGGKVMDLTLHRDPITKEILP